jgi:hypothetical protein
MRQMSARKSKRNSYKKRKSTRKINRKSKRNSYKRRKRRIRTSKRNSYKRSKVGGRPLEGYSPSLSPYTAGKELPTIADLQAEQAADPLWIEYLANLATRKEEKERVERQVKTVSTNIGRLNKQLEEAMAQNPRDEGLINILKMSLALKEKARAELLKRELPPKPRDPYYYLYAHRQN